MTAKIWVLVADSARARFFSATTPVGPLYEESVLVHGESRLQEQALTADRPGRVFDSQGRGRHDMEVNTSAKKKEQVKFAMEIANHLEQASMAGQFRRLYVAADPAFLGLLRDKLDGRLRQMIVGELCKNVTREPADTIRKHLPEKLWMLNE